MTQEPIQDCLKGGAHLKSTSKIKGGPGGGPTLGPMLKRLHRGPKRGEGGHLTAGVRMDGYTRAVDRFMGHVVPLPGRVSWGHKNEI